MMVSTVLIPEALDGVDDPYETIHMLLRVCNTFGSAYMENKREKWGPSRGALRTRSPILLTSSQTILRKASSEKSKKTKLEPMTWLPFFADAKMESKRSDVITK